MKKAGEVIGLIEEHTAIVVILVLFLAAIIWNDASILSIRKEIVSITQNQVRIAESQAKIMESVVSLSEYILSASVPDTVFIFADNWDSLPLDSGYLYVDSNLIDSLGAFDTVYLCPNSDPRGDDDDVLIIHIVDSI